MKLSCMTWNVARKKNLISEQTSFINSIDADIVALQEITKSTNTQFQDILSKSYPHIGFAESPENITLVAPQIEDGIWLAS